MAKNMCYCRFQNTFIDLQDCYEYMDDKEKLSEREQEACEKLIELCIHIALDFGDIGI